jgi:hypothetical protein
MSVERLAAGFATYVSAEEIAREAPAPDDAAKAPTTSIATTVCIISTHCPVDDD